MKTALIAAIALTCLAGGSSLYLANQPQLNPAQQELFDKLTMTWQSGTVAIFTLLTVRQYPPKKLGEAEEDTEEECD